MKGLWRKFRGLPTWVQVVSWIGLVVLIGAAGSSDDGKETVSAGPSTSQVTATTTAPATSATTSAPVTTRATTTTVAVTTTVGGPKTSFGTGTHRVGSDIAPGTYTAPGGSSCYWARLSGFGGSVGDIIANSIGAGSQVATIAASDAGFETRNCGTWTRS